MEIKSGKIIALVCFIYYLVFSLSLGVAASQEEFEWPCFHGLDRKNKSAETDLLKELPGNGPEPLWTIAGLGEDSSVSIANGHIHRRHDREANICVCF